MHIIVSHHAVDRMKQRFGLKFHRYMADRTMIRNLIIGQVSNAKRLNDWKTVPFYVNKMSTTYGPNIEIYLKSGIYFICHEKDNVLSVKTCVPATLYYKKIA